MKLGLLRYEAVILGQYMKKIPGRGTHSIYLEIAKDSKSVCLRLVSGLLAMETIDTLYNYTRDIISLDINTSYS